jgi:hypothetical protein
MLAETAGVVLYWKLLEDMYVAYNSGSEHTHGNG